MTALHLHLVGQNAMPDDALPEISTFNEDLAFVREQKALFAQLSQQGGGWVRPLRDLVVDTLVAAQADDEARAACWVLTPLLTLNADAIEENMAQKYAPGLRLV